MIILWRDSWQIKRINTIQHVKVFRGYQNQIQSDYLWEYCTLQLLIKYKMVSAVLKINQDDDSKIRFWIRHLAGLRSFWIDSNKTLIRGEECNHLSYLINYFYFWWHVSTSCMWWTHIFSFYVIFNHVWINFVSLIENTTTVLASFWEWITLLYLSCIVQMCFHLRNRNKKLE
jgi:hypothetical protein